MLCNIYSQLGVGPGDKFYEWRFYFAGKISRYLSLDEMTDPHFSHDGNRNCLDDLFDHLGVTLWKGENAKRHKF
jgi:hypothetical protein